MVQKINRQLFALEPGIRSLAVKQQGEIVEMD